MAIFGPKPWVNPFGKMSIFRLFELLVFMTQKGVFSIYNIVKDIFLAYIALRKKVGKSAIFRPKAWINPFGKMSIFRLFELVVFIAQKVVFSFQNIVKDTFLAYIALKKKKLPKWPFLDQKHGLILEKCQFFDFLKSLFLQPRKSFFRSRISQKTFSWPILAKKKKLPKWPFLDQKHGLTPWEKCQFFDFLNFLFLQPRKAFLVLKYRKRHSPGLYWLKKKSCQNGHFWTKSMG